MVYIYTYIYLSIYTIFIVIPQTPTIATVLFVGGDLKDQNTVDHIGSKLVRVDSFTTILDASTCVSCDGQETQYATRSHLQMLIYEVVDKVLLSPSKELRLQGGFH